MLSYIRAGIRFLFSLDDHTAARLSPLCCAVQMQHRRSNLPGNTFGRRKLFGLDGNKDRPSVTAGATTAVAPEWRASSQTVEAASREQACSVAAFNAREHLTAQRLRCVTSRWILSTASSHGQPSSSNTGGNTSSPKPSSSNTDGNTHGMTPLSTSHFGWYFGDSHIKVPTTQLHCSGRCKNTVRCLTMKSLGECLTSSVHQQQTTQIAANDANGNNTLQCLQQAQRLACTT